MPTRKQVIYCRLLRDGILHLRMICSGGGWGADEQVLADRLKQILDTPDG